MIKPGKCNACKSQDVILVKQKISNGAYQVFFFCRKCEFHHYAPRHLFDDADTWATGYLCVKCHQEWHKRTDI